MRNQGALYSLCFLSQNMLNIHWWNFMIELKIVVTFINMFWIFFWCLSIVDYSFPNLPKVPFMCLINDKPINIPVYWTVVQCSTHSIHLLTGVEGNSMFVIPEVHTTSRGEAEGNSLYQGDDKHAISWNIQLINVLLYWKPKKKTNNQSFNVTMTSPSLHK